MTGVAYMTASIERGTADDAIANNIRFTVSSPFLFLVCPFYVLSYIRQYMKAFLSGAQD